MKLIDTLVGLATNTDLCMFADILANGDIGVISRLLRLRHHPELLLKVTRNQYNLEFRDWETIPSASRNETHKVGW